MKEFANQYGLDVDELGKMRFIVTDKGEPMIIKFTSSNSNEYRKIMKQNGITPAVIYSGLHFNGITSGVETWNGYNHGIFEKYVPDDRINKTNQSCVESIIQDCGNNVTVI